MRTNEITEGNLYKAMLSFALPFLIANFIQILYGAVDLAVVGWFADTTHVSAVSNGTQVTQLVVSLIAGLTLGGTILIGQYIGANRKKDVEETIATTFTMFLLIAIVLTVVMFIFTPLILDLMKIPEETTTAARSYVYICSAGIIFIFAYNAVSSILRGMGDAKSPVYFILAACISNIILDIMLVGGFRMGAAGAAIATVISQALSVGLSIWYLRKKEFAFDFHFSSFRIHKQKAKLILKMGLPVSLQESVSSLSFLMIASIVNSYGLAASAAYGICTKFEGFAMLPATALAGSISTMAAQNMGAGKPKRASTALRISIQFAFISSFVFFIWAQIAPESILQIFKGEHDVILAGCQYLKFFSFDFMLVAFGFTMNGFFNGCGCTFFAMMNGMAASVFIRIPLTYLFTKWMPNDLIGIGAAIPLATLISVIFAFLYYARGTWRKMRVLENGSSIV